MSHLDPNEHTPVSRAMRACYKDKSGVEHVPAHITVINDEWYTTSSLLALAALRPSETST